MAMKMKKKKKAFPFARNQLFASRKLCPTGGSGGDRRRDGTAATTTNNKGRLQARQASRRKLEEEEEEGWNIEEEQDMARRPPTSRARARSLATGPVLGVRTSSSRATRSAGVAEQHDRPAEDLSPACNSSLSSHDLRLTHKK
jgi:hypothetical protein